MAMMKRDRSFGIEIHTLHTSTRSQSPRMDFFPFPLFPDARGCLCGVGVGGGLSLLLLFQSGLLPFLSACQSQSTKRVRCESVQPFPWTTADKGTNRKPPVRLPYMSRIYMLIFANIEMYYYGCCVSSAYTLLRSGFGRHFFHNLLRILRAPGAGSLWVSHIHFRVDGWEHWYWLDLHMWKRVRGREKWKK